MWPSGTPAESGVAASSCRFTATVQSGVAGRRRHCETPVPGVSQPLRSLQQITASRISRRSERLPPSRIVQSCPPCNPSRALFQNQRNDRSGGSTEELVERVCLSCVTTEAARYQALLCL